MGCCASTSSWNSTSIEERVSPSFWGIAPCGQKRTRGPFSGHVPKVKHLPSIPNRIITNGKSRTSCLFTQQGGKGVNQDAVIVWEVSYASSIKNMDQLIGPIFIERPMW